MEDRTLLTAYVVDTLDDVVDNMDGFISLREAIAAANGNAISSDAPAGDVDGDSITFDASITGGTITLDSTLGQLEITDDLTINGGNPGDITISGNSLTRIFSINANSGPGLFAVSLLNLNLEFGSAANTAGSPGNDGGAIFISDGEDVTLDMVTITNSTAAGNGGAIFAGNGTLNVTNSQIGNQVLDNDVWSNTSASIGDKVFAFVDDSTATLEVLNNSGTSLLAPFDPVAAGVEVDEAGNVFYDVNSFAGEITPYEIYTSVVADAPIGENDVLNDLFVTADVISEDTLRAGSTTAVDTDIYQIVLGATDNTLVVIMDNNPNAAMSATGTIIEIIDTNQSTVLATNLFSGGDADAAIATNLTGGAIYYVRVTSTNTGDYEFVAKAVGPGDLIAETEVNNSPGVADSLTAAQFGQGDILQNGGNQAVNGGGIYVAGGTLNLDFTVVSNNIASGSASTDQGGGGIYSLGGTVSVTNSSSVDFNSANSASGSGGGILANGGSLTITDSSVSSNIAGRAGGGVELRSSVTAVTSTITDSNFSDNSAVGTPGNGGGLHVTAPTGANTSTVTITAGNFTGNFAAAEGGGLWNDVLGTMTIRGVNIDNNIASGPASDNGGGGVFNNGGTVTIQSNGVTATSISGNSANGAAGSGGGILNDGGTLTITAATIAGNSAVRAGGGIEVTTANGRNSVVTLTNVALVGNLAISGGTTAPGNGGGVHISDAAGGNASTFTIVGGSVTGNSAAAEGGGLWNAVGGTLNVRGVTISGNTASGAAADQGGGGIFNDGGTVNIQNNITVATIISNNVANGALGSGGGILNDGGTLSITGATINANTAMRAGGGIEVTTANTRDSIVTLTRANITNNTVGNSPGNGGGVHITDLAGANTSTFTVNRGTISGNSAAAEGGGLWNDAGGTLNINGTTISGNTASGALADQGGGGVFNNGGIVVIQNSTTPTLISNNIANGALGSGGGILNDGGTLTIIGGTIIGNSAVRAGGGIEVTTVNTRDSIASLTNVTIANNTVGSSPGNGGGVHISDAAGGNASTFTITGGAVTDNSAAAEGGGLWNDVGGVLNIDGTVIEGNTASGNSADQGGGGIFNNGGTVNITNDVGTTVISANIANGSAGSGGGILNDGGTLNITGASIDGNAAVRAGGGIEVTTANTRDSIVTIANSTITNNAVGSSPGNGGGVHITDVAGGNASTFTVNGGSVTGNSATAEGGGLWNDVGGTLIINGVAITGNTASGAGSDQGGGGVFNNGGNVFIQGSGSAVTTISSNVANGAAGSGGGILNDGGTLSIIGAIIDGNSAVRAGGGIEVTTVNARNSTAALTGVTISNNRVGSSPGNGGGVHVTDATGGNISSFTLTGGAVTGNSAANEGGGLWNAVGGTMTVNGTTISANTAGLGGGVFNLGKLTVSNSTLSTNFAGSNGGGVSNSGTLDLSQVTVSGNTAGQSGGGVFNTSAGTADIINSTITNNLATSGTGGGLSNTGSTVTLESTIIAGNFNTATIPDDVNGAVNAASQFNLIGVNTGLTGITDGTNNNVIGTAGTPIDALLGALADNGGPTLTHLPQPGSPAINAGSNPDDLDFDQRLVGFPRTIGPQTDIGAVEAPFNIIVVGSGPGSSLVNVFDALSGELLASFSPYGTGFLGAIRTAVGDVNGDGVLDIITGAGPGGGPHVKVLSGADNFVTELFSFFAFDPSFMGGVYVASANFNPGSGTGQDNNADIVVGADAGANAHVKVFNGTNLSERQSFFAYAGFAGGVRVGTGDITGDGIPDIITGAGPGAPGGHVKVFDGSLMQFTTTPTNIAGPLGSFFAYGTAFTGGVFVASGDINGDGRDDIITGAGAGGGPHVKVFNGLDGTELLSFFAYDPNFLGGVTVGSTRGPGDQIDDVITGPGQGGGPVVSVFSGVGGTATLIDTFFGLDSTFTGGIFVSGGVSGAAPDTLLFGGGTIAGDASPLSQGELNALVGAAMSRLEASGASSAVIEALSTVDVRVSNLAGGVLGVSLPGTILIDIDAAGAGWYIDPTPGDDAEFDANLNAVDAAALGRVDLLTVLLHELGHQLGADDVGIIDHPEHLMAESLTTGKRRLPNEDLDVFFSNGELLDSVLS